MSIPNTRGLIARVSYEIWNQQRALIGVKKRTFDPGRESNPIYPRFKNGVQYSQYYFADVLEKDIPSPYKLTHTLRRTYAEKTRRL